MTELAEQERFMTLIEEHKKILFKVAGTYCRNTEDRRDLTQEIMGELWRSFGRFDNRARFSTWMYRVAMNVAISRSRQELRRASRTTPIEESALFIAAPQETPDNTPEELRQLHGFINGELSELDRALVILYLDGSSYETIGEILGISSSNVGTRLGRIKERLRQYFDRTNPN